MHNISLDTRAQSEHRICFDVFHGFSKLLISSIAWIMFYAITNNFLQHSVLYASLIQMQTGIDGVIDTVRGMC